MAKNRVGGIAVDQLKSIIARVEKLEEEKTSIAADIRDVFAEAKGNGFDVKAIRDILKIRKMDAQELEEQETIFDTYRRALGMLPELDEDENTPLFSMTAKPAEPKGTPHEKPEEDEDENTVNQGAGSLERQAAAYT
jgi:uncharacterized protein (UPF0335 family)